MTNSNKTVLKNNPITSVELHDKDIGFQIYCVDCVKNKNCPRKTISDCNFIDSLEIIIDKQDIVEKSHIEENNSGRHIFIQTKNGVIEKQEEQITKLINFYKIKTK